MVKKERYILTRDGYELGRGKTIQDIADVLECSRHIIYKNIQPDGTFKFRKKIYQLIDKFDLI
jgi:hypothetical protein